MKQYKCGTSVMCDFHFGGKPHGKVVEVVAPGNGRNNPSGKCRVKITNENHGAYRKGEIIEIPAWQCVPHAHVFTRGYFLHVRTNFEWIS